MSKENSGTGGVVNSSGYSSSGTNLNLSASSPRHSSASTASAASSSKASSSAAASSNRDSTASSLSGSATVNNNSSARISMQDTLTTTARSSMQESTVASGRSSMHDSSARSSMHEAAGGYTSYVTGGAGMVYEASAAAAHELGMGGHGNSGGGGAAAYDMSKLERSLGAPMVHDEQLAHEVLAKAGPANTYMRRDHSHDIGESASYEYSAGSSSSYQQYSSSYDHCDNVNVIKIEPPPPLYSASSLINQDPDPIRIVKPNDQNLVYKQQVSIRYLQPPTPPPSAPIIIREKQMPPPPTQPPIIIRQTAPAPPTPPPLTIRERAPTPPPQCEPTIIERPIPPPPAPPRQVIIERVPAPPVKPRPIIYEKWLPYKSTKRPVIVQKVKQAPCVAAPKNVIIEYEKAKAVAIRQVIEEGVFRCDPATYQSASSHGNGEVRFVDRITDLPIENSRILAQLQLDSAASSSGSHHHHHYGASSSSSKKELNLENCSELYAQLLGSSGSYSDMHSSSNIDAALLAGNYFSSSSHQNVEYETITTSVPESLAAKIIAEARAAGAISRSANDKC